MASLRLDLTTNDWVIFSPERAKRVTDFKKACPPSTVLSTEGQRCPFCPGNESLTGAEIYALRQGTAPNSPGWKVRVVPNRFPALRIEEEPRRTEDGPFFRYLGGCGAHEVIIESPDHNSVLCQLPVEQIETVLRTLQLRFNDLMRDERFQTIVIFKNHGEGAGTSLRHPHWQLIATPVVPRLLRLKLAVATDYFDMAGSCLYCQLLAEELAAKDRVVLENRHYAAIIPFASHVPFETWIFPKVHQASFGSVDAGQLRPLAELLRDVLWRLHVGLDNPDFNLTINTVPRGDEDKKYFLWHVQIVPRLTTPAGFELGSGMSVNAVLPEEAAAFLRQVTVAG
jgi:UDPglucose--hexose-1-phosphate uridylyltransferase